MEEKAVQKPGEDNISDFDLVSFIRNETNDDILRKYYGIFYQRYNNYVFKKASAACSKFTNTSGFAEDLTHEIFLIAIKAIKKFAFSDEVDNADHGFVLKAWLGKIANIAFLKLYSSKDTYKVSNSIENFHVQELDDQFCPICDEFLIEDKKILKCSKGHYKIRMAEIVDKNVEPTFDLFEDLYSEIGVDVPNDLRMKLEKAMDALSEREKTIILKYAAEFCIGTGRHISDESLDELCKLYNTSPDNIKHIKLRALNKIRTICFSRNY